MRKLTISIAFWIIALKALAEPLDPKISAVEIDEIDVQVTFVDNATGGLKYELQQSPDLTSSFEPAPGAVISASLSDFLASAPKDGNAPQMFYRIAGQKVAATASFTQAGETIQLEEDEGTHDIEIQFVDANGAPVFFNGTIAYSWSGSGSPEIGSVGALTGEVNVRGTSGVIPLVVVDNAGQQDLKRLNLDLELRPDGEYDLNLQKTSTSVVISENDIHWRGVMEIGGERQDLKIYVRKESSGVIIWLDGTETLGGLGNTGPATDLIPPFFVGSVNNTTDTVFSDTEFKASFQRMRVTNTSPAYAGEGDHELSITLSALASNPDHVVGGYRLTLLDDLASLSGLPATGRHTLVIGRLGGGLAFRGFDSGGRKILDTLETAYPGKADLLAALKETLEPLWATGPTTLPEKRSIHRQMSAITDQDFTESGIILGDIEMNLIPGQQAQLNTTITGRFSLKRDTPQQPDIDTNLVTQP